MKPTTTKLVSRYATIRGLKVHYLESQSPHTTATYPPLLLIAGWPMAGFMLIPMARLLATDRKCYILDLPGYGGSQVHENAYCGFDYHLRFIREFHSHFICTDKISVFGYSTGGVHGINYAFHHPQKVEKLVTFSAPYDGTVQFAEMAVRSPKRFKTLHLMYPFVTSRPKLVRFMNYRVVKFLSMGAFFLAVYVRLYPHAIRACDKRFMLEFFNRTSKFNVKTIFDLAMDLSRTDYSLKATQLTVPTLVMAGSRDTTVKPSRSRKLASLIPRCTFYLVEEADHSVGIVEPHRLVSQILPFLHASV